jgi:ferredoxin
MPVITFEPLGARVEATEGETVFAAARRANLPIPTACVGKGTCGLCRVKVLAGEDALPPINAIEKKHLGNTYFITKLRLSCQLKVSGDVTLLIPDAHRAQASLKKLIR